jgi:hypothetical protein
MRLPRPFALCAIISAAVTVVIAVLILRPVMIGNSIRNELRTLQAGPFSAERLGKWLRRIVAVPRVTVVGARLLSVCLTRPSICSGLPH